MTNRMPQDPGADAPEESSSKRARIALADNPVAQASGSADAASGATPGSVVEVPGVASAASRTAARAQRTISKPSGSVAAAPGSAVVAPEASGAPPSKRQRVLKIMNSGDAQFQEEAEIDHWEQLVTMLKKAAKAGHIWSGDTSCSSTVHFWAVQVVAAMKSVKPQAAPAAAVETPGENLHLCQKLFPDFLLRTLYSQKCFKVLKRFCPIFEDLVQLGCAAPVELDKLKAFANQSTSDLTAPDLANFSSGDEQKQNK